MGSSPSRVCPVVPYNVPEIELDQSKEEMDETETETETESGQHFNRAKYTFDFEVGESRQKFAATIWRTKREGGPKAYLFLCHGYGEYCSATQWSGLCEFMASRGITVFGHDHLGMGNTSGERVQGIASFEEDYCLPVVAHCKARMRQDQAQDIPLFIMGHSMGGLVSLLSCKNAPAGTFRGLIACDPMIEVDPDMATPVNLFLARMLCSVWPGLQLSTVDKSDVTSDKDWVKRLEEDELAWHGGIKVKQAMMALKALQQFEASMSEITYPLLILHGSVDKICRLEGSQRLFERAKSEDKALKTYDHARHNLFIELGDIPERAMTDALHWMENRLGSEEK